MSDKLAIVMPVFNEGAIISTVINKWVEEFEKCNIDYTLFIMNDGSSDNSSSIVDIIAKKNQNIVHVNKENEGHGPTILRGYREECLKSNDFEWILQIDSDNELPSSAFSEIWTQRRKYDFLLGGRKGRKQTLSRKIITLISRMTIMVFYGSGVHDVNSPYRLMRVLPFKNLLQIIPRDTFAPNLIISGYASYKKLRILEIEVDYTPRVTGTVSLKNIKLFVSALKSFYQTIRFRFMINKNI